MNVFNAVICCWLFVARSSRQIWITTIKQPVQPIVYPITFQQLKLLWFITLGCERSPGAQGQGRVPQTCSSYPRMREAVVVKWFSTQLRMGHDGSRLYCWSVQPPMMVNWSGWLKHHQEFTLSLSTFPQSILFILFRILRNLFTFILFILFIIILGIMKHHRWPCGGSALQGVMTQILGGFQILRVLMLVPGAQGGHPHRW